jgi:hypothetical protein
MVYFTYLQNFLKNLKTMWICLRREVKALGQLMCQLAQRTLTLSTILMATTLLCNDGHDAWATAQKVLKSLGIQATPPEAAQVLRNRALLSIITNEVNEAKQKGRTPPSVKDFLDALNEGTPLEQIAQRARELKALREGGGVGVIGGGGPAPVPQPQGGVSALGGPAPVPQPQGGVPTLGGPAPAPTGGGQSSTKSKTPPPTPPKRPAPKAPPAPVPQQTVNAANKYLQEAADELYRFGLNTVNELVLPGQNLQELAQKAVPFIPQFASHHEQVAYFIFLMRLLSLGMINDKTDQEQINTDVRAIKLLADGYHNVQYPKYTRHMRHYEEITKELIENTAFLISHPEIFNEIRSWFSINERAGTNDQQPSDSLLQAMKILRRHMSLENISARHIITAFLFIDIERRPRNEQAIKYVAESIYSIIQQIKKQFPNERTRTAFYDLLHSCQKEFAWYVSLTTDTPNALAVIVNNKYNYQDPTAKVKGNDLLIQILWVNEQSTLPVKAGDQFAILHSDISSFNLSSNASMGMLFSFGAIAAKGIPAFGVHAVTLQDSATFHEVMNEKLIWALRNKGQPGSLGQQPAPQPQGGGGPQQGGPAPAPQLQGGGGPQQGGPAPAPQPQGGGGSQQGGPAPAPQPQAGGPAQGGQQADIAEHANNVLNAIMDDYNLLQRIGDIQSVQDLVGNANVTDVVEEVVKIYQQINGKQLDEHDPVALFDAVCLMKLVSLGVISSQQPDKSNFKLYKQAVGKLLNGYDGNGDNDKRRNPVSYIAIDESMVTIMYYLLSHEQDILAELRKADQLGRLGGDPHEPSQHVYNAAYQLEEHYLLANPSVDQIVAYLYLMAGGRIDLNTIEAVVNLNETLLPLIRQNTKVTESFRVQLIHNVRLELVWRIGEDGGAIPNALARIAQINYNQAQPGQQGNDILIQILWVKPNNLGGNLTFDNNPVQIGNQFAILQGTVKTNLPHIARNGSFVTFNGIQQQQAAPAGGIPAVILVDPAQRH